MRKKKTKEQKRRQNAEDLGRETPREIRRKLVLLFVIIVPVFIILLGQVVKLNVVSGDHYKKSILNQQNAGGRTVPYKRGDILSSDGTKLATNEKVYNVIVDAYALNTLEAGKQKDAILRDTKAALRECFGIKGYEFDKVLKENPSSRYSQLKKDVDYESGQKFSAKMNEENSNIEGIWLESKYNRKYPFDTLACDVIGFLKNDNTGNNGLEAYYDNELSGIDGREYYYQADGTMNKQISREVKNGYNIVTTIDLGLQKLVEEDIKEFNEKLANKDSKGIGSKNTGVIVMNPNTGEILAEAGYPAYNLNEPNDMTVSYSKKYVDRLKNDEKVQLLQDVWKNFCVSDTFEPGSVVKPFTVASGLETGALKGDETFKCEGYLEVGGHKIKCHENKGHGVISVADSIAKSCNVALMEESFKIGKDNFCRYQSNFGFGQKTGVDLPGEASTAGLIYSADKMRKTDLATNAFGQNFNATMTQVAAAFCSLVNGGNYYKPHIVKEIQDDNGNVIKSISGEVIKKTVSKSTSKTLRSYMKGTVDHGTGVYLQVPGYSLGGKTGTAEKLPRGKNKNILSFIGFAPVKKPEVVVYVVLDEPNLKDQSETGYVLRLTKSILEDILPYLNITKETKATKIEKAE